MSKRKRRCWGSPVAGYRLLFSSPCAATRCPPTKLNFPSNLRGASRRRRAACEESAICRGRVVEQEVDAREEAGKGQTFFTKPYNSTGGARKRIFYHSDDNFIFLLILEERRLDLYGQNDE